MAAPTSVNALGWWDPSDTGNRTMSGSNLTALDDKSGNGLDVALTTGSLLLGTSPTAVDTIDFGAGTGGLATAALSNLITGATLRGNGAADHQHQRQPPAFSVKTSGAARTGAATRRQGSPPNPATGRQSPAAGRSSASPPCSTSGTSTSSSSTGRTARSTSTTSRSTPTQRQPTSTSIGCGSDRTSPTSIGAATRRGRRRRRRAQLTQRGDLYDYFDAKWITGTTEHDLVVADALHALASDNVTLTQAHQLIVADAAHALTSDNVTLTQVHVLAVQDAAHALVSDQVAITQVHSLASLTGPARPRLRQRGLTLRRSSPSPTPSTR